MGQLKSAEAWLADADNTPNSNSALIEAGHRTLPADDSTGLSSTSGWEYLLGSIPTTPSQSQWSAGSAGCDWNFSRGGAHNAAGWQCPSSEKHLGLSDGSVTSTTSSSWEPDVKGRTTDGFNMRAKSQLSVDSTTTALIPACIHCILALTLSFPGLYLLDLLWLCWYSDRYPTSSMQNFGLDLDYTFPVGALLQVLSAEST